MKSLTALLVGESNHLAGCACGFHRCRSDLLPEGDARLEGEEQREAAAGSDDPTTTCHSLSNRRMTAPHKTCLIAIWHGAGRCWLEVREVLVTRNLLGRNLPHVTCRKPGRREGCYARLLGSV